MPGRAYYRVPLDGWTPEVAAAAIECDRTASNVYALAPDDPSPALEAAGGERLGDTLSALTKEQRAHVAVRHVGLEEAVVDGDGNVVGSASVPRAVRFVGALAAAVDAELAVQLGPQLGAPVGPRVGAPLGAPLGDPVLDDPEAEPGVALGGQEDAEVFADPADVAALPDLPQIVWAGDDPASYL